jgi:tetratricopeptide (TPR) repeat protein
VTTAVVTLALVLAGSNSSGQPPRANDGRFSAIPFALLQREPARREGIGTAHEAVSTSSREAQRWYDEGLAHLYSFSWIEAARAFNAALRIDERLAMAHLGLSVAYGGLGSERGASDEWRRANDLAAGAGERDRLRIRLRSLQLAAVADPENQAARRDYVDALDRALKSSPRDVDLLLLRGEADGGAGAAGSMASGAGAVRFYDQARQAAPEAFAPHHYLAHAYENSGQVAQAVRASEAYARLAPAVSHAHHMLGHGLLRTDRAAEAIAAFRKALDLEGVHTGPGHIPREYDWHHHHNTSMLAAAYRYTGRMGAAADLLRSAFSIPAPLLPQELDKREWPALLLARGAAADALAAAQKLSAHSSPIVRAAGHLSAAHVHLIAARLQQAAREADAALAELRAAGPEAAVLAPDLRLAQGELFLRGGDRVRGRQMIRDGIASLRARPGPDDWMRTLFTLEASARAARSVGDVELAAQLADELRQHAPAYSGTRFALAVDAERRGDRAAALRLYEEALRGWRDADPDLPDAAEARARIAALPPR